MFFLITLINKIIDVIQILVLIRVLLSWVPNFNNSFTDLVYSLTEPLLSPFRNLLRLGNIYFDLSPIILILVLRIVRYILIKLVFILFF